MKNRVISLFFSFIMLIFVGGFTSGAKDDNNLDAEDIIIESIDINNRSLFPYTIEEEGKVLWGLMNERGRKVIKPAYEFIKSLKVTDEFYLLSEDKVQILDRTKRILLTLPKESALSMDYYNGYLRYGNKYYTVIGKELIEVTGDKGESVYNQKDKEQRDKDLPAFKLKEKDGQGFDIYNLRNKKLNEETIYLITSIKTNLYAVRGEKTTYFVDDKFEKIKGFKEMKGSWEIEKQGALILCYQEYITGRLSNYTDQRVRVPKRMIYLNANGKKIWEGSSELKIQEMGYGLNLKRSYTASTIFEKITYPVVNVPKKKALQKVLEESLTRIGYNQRGGEFYQTGYTATAHHRILEMAWQNIYTTEAGKKSHYLRELNYYDMVTGEQLQVESLFKDYHQFIASQNLKGQEIMLGATDKGLEIYKTIMEPDKEPIELRQIPWYQLYEEIDQESGFWRYFKSKISYDITQQLTKTIKRDEDAQKGQLVHLQCSNIYKVESEDLYYIQLYKEVAYRTPRGKEIQRTHWIYRIKEIISTDSYIIVDKIQKK